MAIPFSKFSDDTEVVVGTAKPQLPLIFPTVKPSMPTLAKGRPFLKWAGGKKQLLPELMKHIPRSYRRYIEPFVGAGALFFHLQPRDAVLGDSNEELINAYKAVRDNVDALIHELGRYVNDEKLYYKVRALKPTDLSDIERAARLIYLNKTCFNGLYRVNKRGQFNVPFGYRIDPLICDEIRLRKAHQLLQGVTLVSGDYKTILHEYATRGDLVYLDPPYFSGLRR